MAAPYRAPPTNSTTISKDMNCSMSAVMVMSPRKYSIMMAMAAIIPFSGITPWKMRIICIIWQMPRMMASQKHHVSHSKMDAITAGMEQYIHDFHPMARLKSPAVSRTNLMALL